MRPKSFVSQILEDLVKDSTSLSEVMLRCRIVASRLGLDEMGSWIDRELKGYGEVAEVPPYRTKQGLPQAYNPYHGWQPIMSKDKDFLSTISKAPIGSPISIIERDAKNSCKQSQIEFGWSAEHRNILSSMLDFNTNVRLLLNPSAPLEIYETVRQLLIDWLLELEKAGVAADDAVASQSELQAAPTATDRFIVNNYGTVANLIGIANQSSQSATLTAQGLADLGRLAQQVIQNSDLLPAEIRQEALSASKDISDELARPSPNQHRLKEASASLRKVAESATGNLLAQGILAVLRSLL